jgi:hypothetical protein
MKKNYFYFVMLLAGIALLAATKPFKSSPYGFIKGTPEIKSIALYRSVKTGSFIGDSKSASVFAVDTKDAKNNNNAALRSTIAGIDQKIAEHWVHKKKISRSWIWQ